MFRPTSISINWFLKKWVLPNMVLDKPFCLLFRLEIFLKLFKLIL
jgi:hypothetical protein